MHKTVFFTNKGLYEYVVMSLRLCNAPITFKRLMDLIFSNFIDKFATIYIDNILVFQDSLKTLGSS